MPLRFSNQQGSLDNGLLFTDQAEFVSTTDPRPLRFGDQQGNLDSGLLFTDQTEFYTGPTGDALRFGDQDGSLSSGLLFTDQSLFVTQLPEIIGTGVFGTTITISQSATGELHKITGTGVFDSAIFVSQAGLGELHDISGAGTFNTLLGVAQFGSGISVDRVTGTGIFSKQITITQLDSGDLVQKPAGNGIFDVGLVVDQLGIGTSSEKEPRGGKGTPKHRDRKKSETPHYYIYKTPIRAEYPTLYGSAEYAFMSAPYKFLRSLPTKPQFDDIPEPQTFSYVSSGGLDISGDVDTDFFDFGNFIRKYDDEMLVLDILTTNENPFAHVDSDRLRQRREDDEILDLL